MTTVERLLQEFIREYRNRGDADPLPYLRKTSGIDRSELAALIDGFLASAPSPPFDAAAFERFRSDPERSAWVRSAVTPETLAELRRKAGLRKADVGARLADRFGLSGRVASAKACYHEIESGQVPPARVRDAVWEALADIFGRAHDQVREAAGTAFERRQPSELAFTRLGAPMKRAASAPPSRRPGWKRESDPVRAAFFVDG